jgi:23S rRNA (uracil1939-C5)-methyltransferase
VKKARPAQGVRSRSGGERPRAPASGAARETVRIESLAAGGAGVARLASGAVVFVPRSAPGELVVIEVSATSKLAHGRVLHVTEPSPERVEPPCPYLDACGGCSFMHLSMRAQEDGHAAIVRAAITHALPGAAIPEITRHPAPAPLAYRTRARLFLKADRRGVRVGYRAASSHEIAAIDACLVLDAAIAPLVGELAAVLAGAQGEGDAAIARGRGGLPVVSLEWRGEIAPATWAALDARVTRGAWAGARVSLHGVGQAATFGDPRPALAGADGAPLVIAAGGFAQPSDEGAARLALRADALSRIEPAGAPRPRHVVELFAGSGTLSVLLARDAASFAAVEIDADACEATRQNLSARGLGGRVVTADADAFSIPSGAAVIVLDPPRAGAPGAAAAIAASAARVVVYVACEPSTLARDLAVMTGFTAGAPPPNPRGRLAITHVETFELFPQTSHVETVVRLERVR